MHILLVFLLIIIITIGVIGIGVGYYFSIHITNPRVYKYEESYNHIKKTEPDVIEMYEKLDKEEVRIESKYGYKLHGIFFPNKKVDKVIILSHGVKSNLWTMLKYGFAYIPKGFSILAYEHRYHGLSGGQNTSYGYYEKDDLKSCVDWVRSKYGKDVKIGLHGESMGSAIVIEYLGMYDNVDFSVDTCGFTNLIDEGKYILRQHFNITLNIAQIYIIFFANIITKIRCGWTFKSVAPIKAIKKTKTPMLFIHGCCDKVVPPNMCKELFEAKENGIKDKYEVKEATHTNTMNLNKEAYIQHLYKFLDSIGL